MFEAKQEDAALAFPLGDAFDGRGSSSDCSKKVLKSSSLPSLRAFCKRDALFCRRQKMQTELMEERALSDGSEDDF